MEADTAAEMRMEKDNPLKESLLLNPIARLMKKKMTNGPISNFDPVKRDIRINTPGRALNRNMDRYIFV